MSRFNYNIFNKFDEFIKKNINPRLYYLLLTPLLFIGNNKLLPLLPVISSAFSIFLVYNLGLFNENENKKDEEASDEETSDEEASHEETSDEEEDEEASDEEVEEEDDEASDEEEGDEEDDEEDDEEEEIEDNQDEEEDSNCLNCNCNKEYINNDNNCKEEKDGDCYLIILTVKNKTQKFILTNELITTYKSKLIELGSIKLDSTNINLIVLEIDVSEDDIEQIKQDNELYDYATFDDTLNILEDVKLECIWRRYKHILSENEYKDNTYTIL